jgi:hypothetical protein
LAIALAATLIAGTAGADDRKPGALDRVRSAWSELANRARGLAGKVVDWGKAAIDWTRKKVADSRLLNALYTKLRGNPVIRWVNRFGQEVVRRLESSARAMVGKPAVTPDVPGFLQRLTEWRRRRAGGR